MNTTLKGDDRRTEPARASLAVRKQVTVLFCDIAGYTARAASVDPEELAEDVREFQQGCARIARTYQGHISSFQGDGIMVLFGHPHASEFSPERAVRAGMDMVEAVALLNRQPHWQGKIPLTIRIGIATGLVVVEQAPGQEGDQAEQIFGNAPNLAARLQAMAAPNTVVVSLKTRRLVGLAFKFRELGSYSLKGFSRPVNAWQILHERPLQKRPRSVLRRQSSAFVSRKRELRELERAFDSACHGFSRFVLVHGDPGIGKSRLLRNFEKSITREEIHRIRINCSPYYQTSFLKPVRDECLRWLRLGEHDDLQTRQASVSWALGMVPLNAVERQLLYSEFLAIEPPGEALLVDMSAEEKRRRTIRVLARVIVSVSSYRPLLVMAEDLHWADPSTLELLGELMRQAQEERILGIFTARPEFEPHWENGDALTRLDLGGLSPAESRQLVDSLCTGTFLPESLKQSLVRKSDGVPLYLEECCVNVLSRQRDQGGADALALDYQVPDTLQDSLNARLDQLGKARALAQLAASFGESFTWSHIDAIARLNDIDADDAMDTLVEENILVVENTSNEDRLRFRHLLFQEAAYQSLLIKTRQQYHEQIADLMRTRDPDFAERHPELVAYHLSKTDQVTQAVDLWIRAGRLAIEKSAFAESIDHLHQGLALVPACPPEERPPRELALLLNLGVSLTARAGYYGYEVTRTYERAVELARAVGDSRQEWTALYGLWRCLISQAEYAHAMRVVIRLSERSRDLGEPILELTTAGIRAMTRLVDGKLSRADALTRKSVALYDRVEGNRAGLHFGQDPYVTVQGLGAVAQLLRGRVRESVVSITRSLETARRSAHPYTVAEALKLAAMYEQIARNTERLRKYCLEAVEISERLGFEGVLATHRIFLAFANLVRDRDPLELDIMRDNLRIYEQKYGRLFLPYFQGILVEGLLSMERFGEAFDMASEMLATITSSGEAWMRPGILYMKSRAALLGGLADPDETRAWYLSAMEIARDQDARLLIARGLPYSSEYGVEEEDMAPYDSLFGQGGVAPELVNHGYITRMH